LEFIDQAEDEARLEFLEGSALRALKVSDEARRGFDRFILIEASRKAKEKLAQRALIEWPTQAAKIELLKDDANDAIADYVKNTNWAKTRALVFLDPFGLQVRWRTIEELAQTRACDVWYLFPIGGVIRMLLHRARWIPCGRQSLTRCLAPLIGETNFMLTIHKVSYLAIPAESRVRMKHKFFLTSKRECKPYSQGFQISPSCVTPWVIPCLLC
jgi:three-Cys-motif partner protein